MRAGNGTLATKVVNTMTSAIIPGSVYITSVNDDTVGAGNSPLFTPAAAAGDWGGIDFRGDLDAVFLVGKPHAPAVSKLLEAEGVRPVSFQRVDAFTAMAVSMSTVWRNLGVMLPWGAVVVFLGAISILTGLALMILVFPLLGHSTWHAYREICESQSPS